MLTKGLLKCWIIVAHRKGDKDKFHFIPTSVCLEVKNLLYGHSVFGAEYPLDVFGFNTLDAPPKSEVIIRVKSILSHMKMSGHMIREFSALNFKLTYKDMLAKEGIFV